MKRPTASRRLQPNTDAASHCMIRCKRSFIDVMMRHSRARVLTFAAVGCCTGAAAFVSYPGGAKAACDAVMYYGQTLQPCEEPRRQPERHDTEPQRTNPGEQQKQWPGGSE